MKILRILINFIILLTAPVWAGSLISIGLAWEGASGAYKNWRSDLGYCCTTTQAMKGRIWIWKI